MIAFTAKNNVYQPPRVIGMNRTYAHTVFEIRRPCLSLVSRPADIIDFPFDTVSTLARPGTFQSERMLNDAERLQASLEHILVSRYVLQSSDALNFVEVAARHESLRAADGDRSLTTQGSPPNVLSGVEVHGGRQSRSTA